MNRSRTRHGRRGYLLLEVMLALAILSLAMVSLISLLGQSIEAQSIMAQDRRLLREMESRLALVRAGLVEEALQENPSDLPGVTFSLQVDDADLRNRDGLKLDGLQRLRLRAAWTEQGEEQVFEVETYAWK